MRMADTHGARARRRAPEGGGAEEFGLELIDHLALALPALLDLLGRRELLLQVGEARAAPVDHDLLVG